MPVKSNKPQKKESKQVRKNNERHSGLAFYSGVMFWGLLAAWAMLNLLASQFSANLNIDASDDQIYSLSKTSQNILQNLKHDLKIYALFSEGQRPTQPLNIYRYLELYASSSSRITVEEIDPELEPERIRPFITGTQSKKQKGRGTNKAPQKNSIIVFRPDNKRFRVIHYKDLYYVIPRFGLKNAGIRAEQQISSAIAYVNGAKVTQLGLLRGHREHSLATIQPNFEQFNMEAQNIELLKGASILETIDVLLVYKPQLDLSREEYQLLRNYLDTGVPTIGKTIKKPETSWKALWLVLDFQAEFLPNFYQLAKDYGIEILEGLVLERDPSRVQAASTYTTFVTPISQLPRPSENEELHPILQPLQDNKINNLLWVQSMAVRQSQPKPHRMRFYNLIESSPASLLRNSRDPSNKNPLPEDLNGPLILMGMTVWQNEQGQRSGPAILLSFDTPGSRSIFTTPSNQQLFYSALSWLGNSQNAAGMTGNKSLIFPSKSLLMLPMRLSQAQAIWWSIAFVIILPLSVLIAGLLFLRHRNNL